MFAVIAFAGFVHTFMQSEPDPVPPPKRVSADRVSAAKSDGYERVRTDAHRVKTAETDRFEKKPRVLFLEQKSCLPCVALKRGLEGEFAALRAAGWTIGTTPDCHIQFVDIDELPQFAAFAANGTPAIVRYDGTRVAQQLVVTKKRPVDRWSIGFLLKGFNERPRPQPTFAITPQQSRRRSATYCPTCRN